jgi:capsular exopolysaccharide synthesis family protein
MQPEVDGATRRGRSLLGGARPRAAASRRDTLNEHLVSLSAPGSFEAERYRSLRHVIEQRRTERETTVIAVTSAAPGDGKTTTAINLAGTLAQAPSARVLLVDADLRLPSVVEQLGLGDPEPGLVEAIRDPGADLEGLVRRCDPWNLSVLPAGRPPQAPYEVMRSPRLGELLQEARGRYDTIVVDTPPLVPVPDGRLLGRWVDGFLLVVAAHRTPRRLVEDALDMMEPERLIGIVFNGDDRPWRGYYGYYGSYGRYGGAARAAGGRGEEPRR